MLHILLRDKGHPHLGFYHNDITAPEAIELSKWTHLAFRYDKETKEQAIFVNGTMVAREGNHGPLVSDGALYLNRWAGRNSCRWACVRSKRLTRRCCCCCCCDAAGHPLKGYMSEFRVWTCLRTERELAEGMDESFPATTPNLVCCWNAMRSQCADGTIVEWTLPPRSGLQLQPSKGLSLAARGEGDGANMQLRFSGAYWVYVGMASSLGLLKRSFTVEAWVRILDWTGADQTILGGYASAIPIVVCSPHSLNDNCTHCGYSGGTEVGMTFQRAVCLESWCEIRGHGLTFLATACRLRGSWSWAGGHTWRFGTTRGGMRWPSFGTRSWW